METINDASSLFMQAQDNEKQIRNLLRTKSILEKPVQLLRLKLRELYEKILLQDLVFAATKDIEQQLWKNVFYKVIEDFRKRIRKFSAAIQRPEADTPQTVKDDLFKCCSQFRSFLKDSMLWYKNLIKGIERTYSLRIDPPPPLDNIDSIHRGFWSIHRCYIFLGDLARYHRDLSENGDAKANEKEWMAAASYYKKASQLLPVNGNPYNQLAVLATYNQREIDAVYYYYRAILAEIPFVTARDNVEVTFERNRQKFSAAFSSNTLNTTSNTSSIANVSLSPATAANASTNNKSAEIVSEHLRFFETRFVRLHGILFTKTNVETFEEVSRAALRDLDVILAHTPAATLAPQQAPQGQGDARPPPPLLTGPLLTTIICMNMSIIHYLAQQQQRADGGSIPGSFSSSWAEVSQRSLLIKLAVRFSLELAARLMTCMTRPQLQPSASVWLGPMCLFFEFLEHFPSLLRPAEGLAREEKAVWSLFFVSLCGIANAFDATAESSRGPPRAALPEEIELRGFAPLKNAHSHLRFQFSKPPDANTKPTASDSETSSVTRMTGGSLSSTYRLHRVRKLSSFMGFVSSHPSLCAKPIYFHPPEATRFSLSASASSASSVSGSDAENNNSANDRRPVGGLLNIPSTPPPKQQSEPTAPTNNKKPLILNTPEQKPSKRPATNRTTPVTPVNDNNANSARSPPSPVKHVKPIASPPSSSSSSQRISAAQKPNPLPSASASASASSSSSSASSSASSAKVQEAKVTEKKTEAVHEDDLLEDEVIVYQPEQQQRPHGESLFSANSSASTVSPAPVTINEKLANITEMLDAPPEEDDDAANPNLITYRPFVSRHDDVAGYDSPSQPMDHDHMTANEVDRLVSGSDSPQPSLSRQLLKDSSGPSSLFAGSVPFYGNYHQQTPHHGMIGNPRSFVVGEPAIEYAVLDNPFRNNTSNPFASTSAGVSDVWLPRGASPSTVPAMTSSHVINSAAQQQLPSAAPASFFQFPDQGAMEELEPSGRKPPANEEEEDALPLPQQDDYEFQENLNDDLLVLDASKKEKAKEKEKKTKAEAEEEDDDDDEDEIPQISAVPLDFVDEDDV